MKKKKVHGLDDTRGSKISSDFGTIGSASTGSYDTTEDLTDTDTSSNPRGHKRSPDDKTKVRFATKENKVHNVESHNDFSPKERGAYWWSDREKDRMMAKHERLVAKYEQQRSGTKPGSKKMSADKIGSYRGLESWTAAGSLKLDHTIEQCITAVMDEQDRQWNENDDDADVIAQKSLAVTEDSARRARLNGLQDAQEALRIRGESWSKLNANDEMSVGSAVSTGTAAVAKKKKRSKLLARLDDSNKLLKYASSDENDDVLKNLKKAAHKKEKKAKKAKKAKKNKSSKSKTGQESDDGDTTDTKTTMPNTVASHVEEQEKSPITNVAVPVSPLATPDTSNDVYPLLAVLRKEQEKLKNSPVTSSYDYSSRTRGESMKSIYDRVPPPMESDEDDIVNLLRKQQMKNALEWTSHDNSGGGNAGIPTRSGEPVSKLSSLREENTYKEQQNMSDPPGRRPRRLASRMGDDDNPRPYDKKKKEKKSSQSTEKPSVESSPAAADDSKTRPNFLHGNMGGILRNGAKSLFKKGAKV